MKNLLRRGRIFALRHMANCSAAPFSFPGGRVCIIAPHPDDEVLGCAGLIQRLCRQNCPPHVVILTGGEKSHASCCHSEESRIKEERRKLAVNILLDLGLPAENVYLLNFPDGSVSPEHAEMRRLESILQQMAPEHLFIPHCGGGWADHLIVREMVNSLPAVSRAGLYEYCVWLWYYNSWNLNFQNAFLLPMTTKEYQAKKEAVHHYLDTLAPCGQPWSGRLPALVRQAALWRKELFFNIK